MSVSFETNSAVPLRPPAPMASEPEEVNGFWERAKDGVGWIVSQVVWFVSVAGKVVIWPFQIVSGLAFQALGVVWPEAAARAEALWGRLLLIGERAIHASREESLLSDVQKLQEKNQLLYNEREELHTQVHVIQGEKDHLAWELDVAIQARDQARGEVSEKIMERAHLLVEKDALSNAKQQLETNLSEMTAEKALAVAEKNAAILAKQQQEVEYTQALQRVEVLRVQLAQAGNNEKLLAELQRIHESHKEKLAQIPDGSQLTMTEAELEKLVPIFDARRACYKEMIQTLLTDLTEEDPLRVPLEGMLDLFAEESEHLTRVSEAIHFYTGLQTLVNQLQATLIH